MLAVKIKSDSRFEALKEGFAHRSHFNFNNVNLKKGLLHSLWAAGLFVRGTFGESNEGKEFIHNFSNMWVSIKFIKYVGRFA